MSFANLLRYGIVLFVATSCLLDSRRADALGVLDAVRSETRESSGGGGSRKEKRRRDDHHHRGHHHDDDNLLASFIGGFLASFFDSPEPVLVVPYVEPYNSPVVYNSETTYGSEVVYDSSVDVSPAFRSYFPCHPYQEGIVGYMMPENRMPIDGYSGAWRARFEYADDFGDLSRVGGRIQWEDESRIGFDTSFGSIQERPAGGPNDELWMGDFNFLFRFAQSEHFSLRTGIGFNWLSDDIGSDFGFNFTLGGDLFLCDPWVLSAEMDSGYVGSASLFHIRGTIGVQLGPTTLYTGYDFLNIEGAKVHGLVMGIEFWF